MVIHHMSLDPHLEGTEFQVVEVRSDPRLCCLDLDTFFVSVERIFDPSLHGRPVIVGGRPDERGVVSACSYEVRRFGVRSGMALRDAAKLAPQAIFLPGRIDVYSDYAERVREIARRFSPEVQIASIDEMYMSFQGCERLYYKPEDSSGDATIERVVRTMTATIRSELNLPSSAGIATSRSMAKVACGLAKPEGVRLIAAGEEAGTLAPLPVRKLPGIGPVAEAKLDRMGIHTLGQVAGLSVRELRGVFGAWAESVKRTAQGAGVAELGRERPAFREYDVDGSVIGSISNERTFSKNVRDSEELSSMLCALSERVCWRARQRGVKARTITLKLRYSNFQTFTRSMSVPLTDSEAEVHRVVQNLYAKNFDRRRAVRLVGIALSNLELSRQLPLIPTDERLNEAVDEIRERFGYNAVRRALGKDNFGS